MSKPTTSTQRRAPSAQMRQSIEQLGFSMIEVLVAIIILSIGMLGAVGMQAAALRSNKETRNQATATTFGRELAEKMRGNKTVAINTTAVNNPYLFDVTLSATTVIAAPTTNCFINGCNDPVTGPADLAKWDVADWQGRAQTALPTPRARVCFDKTPFDLNGIPQWTCTNNGDIAVLKMGWTRSNTAGSLDFAASGAVPVLILPVTPGSAQ
jgi:type IV pilus assembly protein PilV